METLIKKNKVGAIIGFCYSICAFVIGMNEDTSEYAIVKVLRILNPPIFLAEKVLKFTQWLVPKELENMIISNNWLFWSLFLIFIILMIACWTIIGAVAEKVIKMILKRNNEK